MRAARAIAPRVGVLTAMHCDGDKGWFHGHYFDVLKDAWDDLISR